MAGGVLVVLGVAQQGALVAVYDDGARADQAQSERESTDHHQEHDGFDVAQVGDGVGCLAGVCVGGVLEVGAEQVEDAVGVVVVDLRGEGGVAVVDGGEDL